MTDVDTRILEIVSTIFPEGTARDAVSEALQKVVDSEVELAIVESEAALLERDVRSKAQSSQLAKANKENDLLQASLVKQTGFLRQNDEFLMSVYENTNPLIRFLARFASWPKVTSEYLRVKYEATNEVLAELHRQDVKWGEAREQPNGTGPAFGFTEAQANKAKEATDSAFRNGTGTWAHILLEEVAEAMAENNPRRLKIELIQVAAVALAWWVSLTMQKARKK